MNKFIFASFFLVVLVRFGEHGVKIFPSYLILTEVEHGICIDFRLQFIARGESNDKDLKMFLMDKFKGFSSYLPWNGMKIEKRQSATNEFSIMHERKYEKRVQVQRVQFDKLKDFDDYKMHTTRLSRC